MLKAYVLLPYILADVVAKCLSPNYAYIKSPCQYYLLFIIKSYTKYKYEVGYTIICFYYYKIPFHLAFVA